MDSKSLIIEKKYYKVSKQFQRMRQTSSDRNSGLESIEETDRKWKKKKPEENRDKVLEMSVQLSMKMN